MAPAAVTSRPIDVPRPPGSIPHAGGVGSAMGLRARRCRAQRAPVPVLATPSTAPMDRPLPPPTAFAAPSIPITPFEAFKSGARALKDGQKQKAIASLDTPPNMGVSRRMELGAYMREGDRLLLLPVLQRARTRLECLERR